MTCIAWDGTTLAADKRASYGGMICTVTKIKRIGKLLAAGAGDVQFIGAMFAWVDGGRILAEFPVDQRSKDDWQPFLVIEADGTSSLYERTPYPVRYEHKHIALGTGREYARAAMVLGFDSIVAVQTAIAIDSGCGNGIDTLTLEG